MAAEALETWSDADRRQPALLSGRVAAALASGASLPEMPAHRREAIADGVLQWFRTWYAWSAFAALDRALVDIARLEDRLPGLALRAAGWLESIGQAEAADRARRLAGGQG